MRVYVNVSVRENACLCVCVHASKGVRRDRVRETNGNARDGSDLA